MNAVTPPDLVGAGVASPQNAAMNPSSLMAALRQPAMPPDLAGLMSIPRQSPGQAYAQAAAGGVSAMTGQPNPVIQQQQFQQQQAQQYAQMAERVQSRRDRDAEGLLTISKDLLNSESEDARMVGARGLLNHAKTRGMPIQNIEPLIKSMATRRLKASMADIFKDAAVGMDDSSLMLKYEGLDPVTLRSIRTNINNDDVRGLVGLKTARESAKEIADLKISEANAMESESGLKGAPAELKLDIDQEHRRVNVGKPYSEGTPESKARAYQTAYAKYKAIAEQKQALAERTEARRQQQQENFQQLLQTMVLGQGGQRGGGPLGGFEVGAGITPSGGSISLTPRKPLSAEISQQVTGIGRISDATSRVSTILADPKLKESVNEYIGPVAQYKKAMQQKTPMGLAGKVPPHVIDLDQDLNTITNYTIRLITGAQMNLNEEGRIKAELPTFDLPPDDFWRKFNNTLRDVKMLEKRVLSLALSGNQQAQALAQELGLNVPGSQPGAAPTGASPLRSTAPRPKLTRQQYDALRQKGYSDEQIAEKYEVTR